MLRILLENWFLILRFLSNLVCRPIQ